MIEELRAKPGDSLSLIAKTCLKEGSEWQYTLARELLIAHDVSPEDALRIVGEGIKQLERDRVASADLKRITDDEEHIDTISDVYVRCLNYALSINVVERAVEEIKVPGYNEDDIKQLVRACFGEFERHLELPPGERITLSWLPKYEPLDEKGAGQ